jgi:replicative DNA helicase
LSEPAYDRPGQDLGRTPPNREADERALLGAMLLNPTAIGVAVEYVKPADFYQPRNETVFEVILDMDSRGLVPDGITLSSEIIRLGRWREIGDPGFIPSLTGDMNVVPGNAAVYARNIREAADLRRLIETGSRMMQMGYAGEGDAASVFDRAHRDLEAASPSSAHSDAVPVEAVIEETIDAIQALGQGVTPGVMSGYDDLDEVTGGFRPGQFVIVAARPAMGKSTIALDIARTAAKVGQTTYFCSFEMSRQEIMMRLLSAEAKVLLSHIRTGQMTESDWDKITMKLPEIAAMPILINDTAAMSMTEIRSQARRLKSKHNLRAVIIDYMQLMGGDSKAESRQLEVSDNSRQSKLLAKDLEIPVIMLSQVNRSAESRSDKRPMMSDLRESGSLEQDADIVLLLHREDYYDRESSRPGEADLIVAKHRNGPTKEIPLAAQLHYSRFANLTSDTFGR